MTREEQILSEAIDYSFIEDNYIEYDDCGDICDDKDFIQQAFIEGAQWADENPKKGLVDIDRVCEWLDDHLDDYGHDYYDYLIADLRKAMEE